MENKRKGQIVSSLERFADTLPNPFYWLGLNQEYLGVNLFGLKVTGTKSFEESFAGKTPRDLYPESMAEEIVNHHKEVIQTGEIMRVEESIEDVTTKETKFFSATIAPLYDDQENIIGTCGISIDITEEKKLKDQLEIANLSKSEFIANMSHDLRTPLTGILGLAYSLKDHAETKQNKYNAILLVNSTEELLESLNEILEFMQLESGQEKAYKSDFNLHALLQRIIALVEPAAKHRSLGVKCHIGSDVPKYINGYEIYLKRILLNLIANAIKFTNEGAVFIKVELLNKTNKSVKVKLTVEDTGIGIPEDKLDIIFEHFSRLSPAYKGLYKGYGLGLYSVKQYIKVMNGDIEVKSEVNKGSQFIVSMPFDIADTVVKEVEDTFDQNAVDLLQKKLMPDQFQPELSVSVPQTLSTSRCVLLVEDNYLAANMVRNLLQKLQCYVIHAVTGQVALEMASTNQFDMIFMDIGLPDMDGLTVARKIRALDDKKFSTVPIVALSGHMLKDRKQDCLAVGIQDMIMKPLTNQIARELLHRYVTPKLESSELETLSNTTIIDDVDNNQSRMDLTEAEDVTSRELIEEEEFLDLLIKELPCELEKLQAAFEKNDYSTMHDLAHRFYGALCYSEFSQLKEIYKQLTMALNEKKNRDVISEWMQILTREINRILYS